MNYRGKVTSDIEKNDLLVIALYNIIKEYLAKQR